MKMIFFPIVALLFFAGCQKNELIKDEVKSESHKLEKRTLSFPYMEIEFDYRMYTCCAYAIHYNDQGVYEVTNVSYENYFFDNFGSHSNVTWTDANGVEWFIFLFKDLHNWWGTNVANITYHVASPLYPDVDCVTWNPEKYLWIKMLKTYDGRPVEQTLYSKTTNSGSFSDSGWQQY